MGNKVLEMIIIGGKNSWEMPEVTNINKLPPRATFYYYKNERDAATTDRSKSPFIKFLNGKWDFKLKKNPVEATEEALRFGKWKKIDVPGNWTMQGYGLPHYTNVQMPFKNLPPSVPEDNPTGIYRTTFTLPLSWKKRRTVLHFGGCEGALYVYVNKKAVGMNKDARTPAEFDISSHLKHGKNELICVVAKWSDAAFLEDQDHWWQAGIQREVYIYSTTTPHVQDVFARAELSKDLKKAEFKVTVINGFPGERRFDTALSISLLNASGKVVARESIPAKKIGGGEHYGRPDRTAVMKINKPILWIRLL